MSEQYTAYTSFQKNFASLLNVVNLLKHFRLGNMIICHLVLLFYLHNHQVQLFAQLVKITWQKEKSERNRKIWYNRMATVTTTVKKHISILACTGASKASCKSRAWSTSKTKYLHMRPNGIFDLVMQSATDPVALILITLLRPQKKLLLASPHSSTWQEGYTLPCLLSLLV